MGVDKRNATASWSGYLHQGKVGIFLALKKINELTRICEFKDIDRIKNILNTWKIEYESAEDIDIKNSNSVISRHQVKAYKDAKYPNDYKDVLGVLSYKINENGNKVIENKGFRICDFDENAQPLEIEVDENSRYLHTITETLGFGFSKEEFTIAYDRAIYVDNPNNIKLFPYSNEKKYCSISNMHDELKKYCVLEIKNILMCIDHIFKDNTEQQEGIFNHIISCLDNEIRSKHNFGGYPELEFNEIFSLIIDTKYYKKLNIDSIRELFVKSWVCFIRELDESNIEYDKEQEEKIECIVKEIYELNDEKFLQFLKNIHPDEKDIKDLNTIEDVSKLCKIDNIKDVFYECLLYVKKEEFILEDIGYKKDGGYLLTTINRKPAIVKSIKRSIITNSQITNEIFNKKYLINGKIDDIPFNNIIDDAIPEKKENNWGNKATENDIFYNPQMEFISVEKAISKLNRE